MAAACGAARPAKRRAARGELGAMEELEAQEEQTKMEEAPKQMEMTPRQMLLQRKEISSLLLLSAVKICNDGRLTRH